MARKKSLAGIKAAVSNQTKGGRRLRVAAEALDQILAAGDPLEDGSRQTVIAAVDPSISHAGWATALVHEDTEGVISVKVAAAGVCVERVAPGLYPVPRMVEQVIGCIGGADFVIMEFPEVYGTAKNTDPNDLFPLVAVLGGIISVKPWRGHLLYTPNEWKGFIPKDVHQERYLRDVPQWWQDKNLPDHNATDAALLLLWLVQQFTDQAQIEFI